MTITQQTTNYTNYDEHKTADLSNMRSFEIPSRREFHRYACNYLNDECFCTEYPNPMTASYIEQSLRWTEKICKRRKNNGRKKNND